MADHALTNQMLCQGKAEEVKQLSEDASAEGRSVDKVPDKDPISGMAVETPSTAALLWSHFAERAEAAEATATTHCA